MLTDEDKEKLYQEELYRKEVREQLDSGNSKVTISGKIWMLINSAFFLWLLSSVFLGIISFWYASWDKQKTLDKENREREALSQREKVQTIKKLDAEISNRLSYFVAAIRLNMNSSHLNTVALSEDGIKSLDDPNVAGFRINIYPEYTNRNFRSLLLELRDLLPDQERSEIEGAYNRAVQLQYLYLRIVAFKANFENGRKATSDQAEQFYYEAIHMLESFSESINLKRWGEPVSALPTSERLEGT
jgi:hypothetical protein